MIHDDPPVVPAAVGDLRYDYTRQCWTRLVSVGVWRIERCGHPQPFRFPCYACVHAGETLPDTDGLMPRVA